MFRINRKQIYFLEGEKAAIFFALRDRSHNFWFGKEVRKKSRKKKKVVYPRYFFFPLLSINLIVVLLHQKLKNKIK